MKLTPKEAESVNNLIEEYQSEYKRTMGKDISVRFTYGKFRIGNKAYTKKDINRFIDDMLEEDTAEDHYEMVNGKRTFIPAHEHVVKSIVGGKDVVEKRDTPYGCSVADEAYWAM